MNEIILYINITLKKYNSFENIIELIKLIDENVAVKDNICGSNYLIDWTRAYKTQYDYKCKINSFDSIEQMNEKINNYIKVKFHLIQNYIKFNYDSFGTDWTIYFVINK
jgi:hypothetical protein